MKNIIIRYDAHVTLTNNKIIIKTHNKDINTEIIMKPVDILRRNSSAGVQNSL